MLRVLSMYNNISRLPPVLILFVSVAIVTTSNAKSSEALDFGETSVAASRLTEKLEHSLQYKNRNCSISNNNNNNLTSLVCTAGTAAAAEVGAFTGRQILSRRKRYLAFPVGSSFSCAVCLTTGVLGNPNYQFLSLGLNWGFAYDLPNATWVLDHVHALGRKKGEKDVEVVEEPTIKRRHRRDLYHKVETIINNMGYNGRECVLRALCESRQYFARNKMGMIGEMLRVVFSLPKQRLFTRELRENSEILAYDHAYRKARTVNCATHYDCSFSLLELAFGKYARPPIDYYNKFGM